MKTSTYIKPVMQEIRIDNSITFVMTSTPMLDPESGGKPGNSNNDKDEKDNSPFHSDFP